MRISRTFITGTRTERRARRIPPGNARASRATPTSRRSRDGAPTSRRHGIRPDAAPAIPATLTAAANAANADTILR